MIRTRPAPVWSAVLTLVGLCGPLVSPSSLRAQRASFGPLTSEEGAPLQRISYTAMMEAADVLGSGAWSVESWMGFSNIFEQDSSATHVLFMDLERLISTVAVRWGAVESLELGARLTLVTTGAGALDAIILGWHERLGFGQANRDRFPEGAYRQTLTDGGQEVFLDIPKRTLEVEDIRTSAKWRVVRSRDGRSVLSLRTEARIPIANDLGGKERTDVAVMALGRLGIGAWYAHGMIGGATVRASPELAPILASAAGFLSLAVERSLGGSLAAVVQFQSQTALLRSFQHRELDRAPTNLVLGLAGRLGESWNWDASFQEDIPADTPAVDFTIGLRVSRSW